MIAIAPYPQGFKLDQPALSYYYYNLNNKGPIVSSEKYKRALHHYTTVKKWCDQFCIGPYSIEKTDILYDGIRVRLGTNEDLAYFTLTWI
jgi:hypothetical protein